VQDSVPAAAAKDLRRSQAVGDFVADVDPAHIRVQHPKVESDVARNVPACGADSKLNLRIAAVGIGRVNTGNTASTLVQIQIAFQALRQEVPIDACHSTRYPGGLPLCASVRWDPSRMRCTTGSRMSSGQLIGLHARFHSTRCSHKHGR
jgi:hypothetical protein